MHRDRPNAFTLIELLVVVAIIIALIAILLPSMSKAIDATHLAVCGSQQRQIGTALLQYATDHTGQFPEGNASSWNGFGIDTTWLNTASPWPVYAGKGQPMGLAFLLMNGYFDAAEAMYCPAWTHPYAQYDTVDTAGLDNWGAPNTYGGWPQAPNPGPNFIRIVSYNYRTSIGTDPNVSGSWQAPGARAARLAVDAGTTALVTDHFTERLLEWDDFTHTAGYMVLFIDNSSRFRPDGNDHEYISTELGYFSHNYWGEQERVWQEFFEQ